MATTSKYDFEDLTVESCFERYYVVPDYQREYVWEADKQVAQLLNDIYEAYSGDSQKEYFLGTTVVFNNNGVNELIDGQQRTTTLFLMLCAFYNRYTALGLKTQVIEQHINNTTLDDLGQEVHKYHLELQYDEASNLLTNIYVGIIPDASTLHSNGKIIAAYKYMCFFLEEEFKSDKEELGKFFMYFFRKLKFIQILTPDINDALKIFETINDRGIGLSPMDLLKNLIFRQVPRDQFFKIKDKWKMLVDTLNTAREKPLRFLRYFIVSNYPSTSNGKDSNKAGENVLREELIFDWMTKHADLCGYEKDPMGFVELLVDNAKAYVNFAQGRDAEGNNNVYLQNIYLLGGSAFRQHLIALLPCRQFSREMFTYLTKCLETYLFYCLFIKDSAKIYEIIFGRWDLELVNVKTMDDLNAFVDKYIKPEIDKRKDTYKLMFSVFKQSDWQIYRVRYLLARMSQYVDQARRGIMVPEILEPYISKGVEIEHILPQTPLPGMTDRFEDYDTLKFRLGNLTLLEKSFNSVVSNKEFEDKVEVYGKSQYYLTSSIKQLDTVGTHSAINKLNEKLEYFDRWDADTVEYRQMMMYELSLDIWNLKNPQ